MAIMACSATVRTLILTAIAPKVVKAAAMTEAARKGTSIDFSFCGWWFSDKEKAPRECSEGALFVVSWSDVQRLSLTE